MAMIVKRQMAAFTAVALAIGFCSRMAGAADSYSPQAGPEKVARLEATWRDEGRGREVPVLICYPERLASFATSTPVIVFSHGLGGTRESYAHYGTHWASYGYVVVFPQHHGSDSGVIGHGMMEMLHGKGDLQPFLDRVQDVHFVIDQITSLEAGKLAGKEYAPFKAKLDLTKIGMSGHSFGAVTTQAVIGQRYTLQKSSSFQDSRIKAAVVMSGSGGHGGDYDRAFGGIQIPTYYLTGTEDRSPETGPAQRRIPFDHSVFPDTFLLTLVGAKHMTFGGRGEREGGEAYQHYQNFILESTTAFWDAYLKGDAGARSWFTKKFPKVLGHAGTFETKLKPGS